jgi:predicted HicB family RNase H-like nuclease
MAKSVNTLNVRVGPKLDRAVKLYAEAREMTVSEFVRYCLKTYIDTTPIVDEWDTEENLDG